MTNSNRPAKCRDCGTTQVAWEHSKAGKWYLADVRGSKIHSAAGTYNAGPHYLTCEARGPRADRMRATDAHNAKVEAERAAHQARMQAFADAGDWDGMRAYIEKGDHAM